MIVRLNAKTFFGVSFDHFVGAREQVAGMSRPSAFAVVRLMISSYFRDPDWNRIEVYCWRMTATGPSMAAPHPDL